MRTMVAMVVAAVAAGGCAPSGSMPVGVAPAAETDGWGEPANGLRLRIQPARARFTVGDEVAVVLTLQNVSDRPLSLLHARAAASWLWRFEFRTLDGREIPCSVPAAPEWGEWTLLLQPVQPGGTAEHRVVLNPWRLLTYGDAYAGIGSEGRTFMVTGVYRTPAGLEVKAPDVWTGSVCSGLVQIRIEE